MNITKFTKFSTILSWMLLIFLTSSIAVAEDDPNRIKEWYEYFYDKDTHLLLFGILAYFIISFLKEYKFKFYHIGLFAIFFCAFYGITDEWHQGFTAGRGVSYWDLTFDAIGAIAGVFFYQIFFPIEYGNKTKRKK